MYIIFYAVYVINSAYYNNIHADIDIDTNK